MTDSADADEQSAVQNQSSRVSIRPVGRDNSRVSTRQMSASGSPTSYSQFGARGGKFSSSTPKSDVEWAIFRAKQCPGPGQYPTNRDFMPRGGRFNMSNPKSDIDWLIKAAAETPGPSDYNFNNKSLKPSGGRFSTARPKSALEWTIFNARERPGPGHYQPDANYKVNGGRFSDSKPKSDVDWCIYRAKQQPGPGQYHSSKELKLSGGKFNMSKPKSDVDWAIMKAAQSPSAQDYNPDASYKVVGGRFSQSRPKSALDWEIYRSKQLPGPGEYNSELQSIGRRATGNYRPSDPSLPAERRPKTAHTLPPEARGKVRPKSSLGEMSAEKLHGTEQAARPATSSGIRAADTRNLKPSGIPSEGRGKPLPPRATSAPPGPRMVAPSPKSSAKPAVVSKDPKQTEPPKQRMAVTVPRPRPSSSPQKGTGSPFVGEEPRTYHLQSKRPSSVIESRSRAKTKTISTQASEESWMLFERQRAEQEKERRDKAGQKTKAEQKRDIDARKVSSVGRPLTASQPLTSDDLLGPAGKDQGRQTYQRLRSSAGQVQSRAARRIPIKKRVEDKKKIVYPVGQKYSTSASSTRAKLSDNARKLFDLAMQSNEFRNMMELYTGVKDPTDVIEKYAQMWSYQPLFEGNRTR